MKIKNVISHISFLMKRPKKPSYRRTKKKIDKLKRMGLTKQQIIEEMTKEWPYVWSHNRTR